MAFWLGRCCYTTSTASKPLHPSTRFRPSWRDFKVGHLRLVLRSTLYTDLYAALAPFELNFLVRGRRVRDGNTDCYSLFYSLTPFLVVSLFIVHVHINLLSLFLFFVLLILSSKWTYLRWNMCQPIRDLYLQTSLEDSYLVGNISIKVLLLDARFCGSKFFRHYGVLIFIVDRFIALDYEILISCSLYIFTGFWMCLV